MIAASTVLLAAIANFNAPDLCRLEESKIGRYKPDAIEWIKDGKATMPIVSAPGKRRYGPRGWMYPATREAQWLAQVVFEMTGVKPPVIVEAPGKTATNSPAVYIGTSACKRFADAIVPSEPKDTNTVVYNNFPFPNPTEEQKSAIEKTAQAILDVRALYPDSSLADLYDPLTMPPELRKAHEANDKAVEKAYGRKFADEAEIVAYLMQEYQRLVSEKK